MASSAALQVAPWKVAAASLLVLLASAAAGEAPPASDASARAVRFFGGWNVPLDLCAGAGFDRNGYLHGVPMGSDLTAIPEGTRAPRFAVRTLRGRDPLERLQVVKGWADAQGRTYDVVYSLGDASPSQGPDELCAVWEDPHFDPAQPAFYYARMVEGEDAAGRLEERAWSAPIWFKPAGDPADRS